MSDPVTKFLADLDDPEKFLRVDSVPIFVAHKRKVRHSDGKDAEVVVTEADLQEIAEHAQKREEESGTPLRVSLGHVQARNPDEKTQPDVVGAAKNLHVGEFGPGKKTALLCSLYLKRDRADEARGFPFRSVEYYPARGEITGVALLRRDPELDLGMISYASRDGSLLCYSSEANMPDLPPPDPTTPPDAAAPGPDDLPPPAPAADPGEDYERHCYGHPGAAAYYQQKCAKYAMATPGATSGDLPAPTPGDMPPPEGDAPPETFARGDAAVQYQRVAAENAKLKKQVAEKDRALADLSRRLGVIERDARVVQYTRELEQAAEREEIVLDVADELAIVANYSRQQFDAHLARLVKVARQNQTGPVGGTMLPVARQARQEFGQRELDLANQYMRAHPGCTWDHANEYARGERTLTGTPVQTRS